MDDLSVVEELNTLSEFNDSILKSITSQSVLELAKMGRIKAVSEQIAINDFLDGVKNGEIIEALSCS